jgi:hypothetical protein
VAKKPILTEWAGRTTEQTTFASLPNFGLSICSKNAGVNSSILTGTIAENGSGHSAQKLIPITNPRTPAFSNNQQELHHQPKNINLGNEFQANFIEERSLFINATEVVNPKHPEQKLQMREAEYEWHERSTQSRVTAHAQ